MTTQSNQSIKKQKVLLLQPPQTYYGRKRDIAFPIGLGYIAAVLKEKEYPVKVLDLNAIEKTDSELLDFLKKEKFEVIAISAMSVQFNHVERLVNTIRKLDKKTTIVLGGALAIHSYNLVLNNLDIDFCALGEGESILLEILQNISSPQNIRGVAYIQDGRLIVTSPMPYITNLDSLPFPAWDLFPIDLYIAPTKSMTLISGRGCPFNCNFCSKNFKGIRLRSIKNIVDEIKVIKKKFKIANIGFDDELVVVNKKRTTDLCKELKKLNIIWSCQGRVNYATIPLLRMMKDAGCAQIGFGVESGSQKILKNMNKATTIEMITNAIKNANTVGLNYCPQMIFGYVGEDEKTLKETANLCLNLGMTPAFNVATPYPGTKLYEWAKENGKIKDELKFLKNLQGNAELYINCSTFPNKDVLKIKKKFEKKILRNYIIYSFMHPSRLIKDNSAKFKFLINTIKTKGIIYTLKELIRAIKKYPQIVFGRY